MFKIKLGAIAVAFALTAVMPADLPYTGGLIGTPVAHAGILGKIKGAVTTVGSEAKKFATDTAKAAKNAGKIAGGKVGGEVKRLAVDSAKQAKAAGKIVGVDRAAKKVGQFGKDLGRAAKNDAVAFGGAVKSGAKKINLDQFLKDNGKFYGSVGKAVGRGIKRGAVAVGGVAKDIGRAAKDDAVAFGRGVKKGGATVWNGVKKLDVIWKGNKFEPPEVRLPPENKPIPVAPPNEGISRDDLGLGRDKSQWGRPVGVTHKPNPAPGQTLNIQGSPNPIPVKAPNQGMSKDNLGIGNRAPNQGISKGDLGIGRDKSKSGRPVGVKRKMIGRDKSVWGRPLGVSKHNVQGHRKIGGRGMRDDMRLQVRNKRERSEFKSRHRFKNAAMGGSGHGRRHR